MVHPQKHLRKTTLYSVEKLFIILWNNIRKPVLTFWKIKSVIVELEGITSKRMKKWTKINPYKYIGFEIQIHFEVESINQSDNNKNIFYFPY